MVPVKIVTDHTHESWDVGQVIMQQYTNRNNKWVSLYSKYDEDLLN